LSTERPPNAAVVDDALDSLWPGRFSDAGRLPQDEPLGDGGLGLDSIEIVELVLACLSRAGLPGSRADALLEAGPLTVAGLIDHLGEA
jgi:acyl carrier protein